MRARRQLDRGREAALVGVQRRLDSNTVAGLGVLRRHLPLVSVPPVAVVTRREDVDAVLADSDTFALPYRRKLTGPFLLGLTGAELERHRSELEAVVRPADLPFLRDLAADAAERRVRRARTSGVLDVGTDLVHPVLDEVVGSYLGVPAPRPADQLRWARDLFQEIFLNPTDLAGIRTRARRSAGEMTAHVERCIAGRRADPDPPDDVLSRLLARQEESERALDDRAVRDNLIGLAIGWLWHGAKAAITTVDELVNRPDALAEARDAARDGDEARLQRLLWEVLRFRPVQAGLVRIATCDTVLADGTPHARRVGIGTTVFVGTHSAMWDERVVPDPQVFDATRAAGQYLIFGAGPHSCFGEQIMRRQLPAMLAPLLRSEGLRRAEGGRGRLRWQGPSPDGFRVLLAGQPR